MSQRYLSGCGRESLVPGTSASSSPRQTANVRRYALRELPEVAGIRPEDWRTWEKIPWDDEAFSERMLREHLSQEHDLASRTTSWIESACDWLHTEVLAGRPARILDLGCGPGLYARRLADAGHRVTGIDFSPASVRHAREFVPEAEFRMADVRDADFGVGYDLAILLFGELSVFPPAERRAILDKVRTALVEGGQLVVEVHRAEPMRQVAEGACTWSVRRGGLFDEGPHLVLEQAHWWEQESAAAFRTLVATSDDLLEFRQAVAAQTKETWVREIERAGFQEAGAGPQFGPGEEFDVISFRTR